MILLGASICVFWAFVLVFFANEIGQRFSDTYENIEREIGQLKWYYYPTKLKQRFPILIFNVQQPIAIQFFGSAVCGRAQFQKVSFVNIFEIEIMVF